MRVQRCKDRAKHIKASNNPYLTYHFAKWRLQFM
nr:MAG TPA: hypothetical protein [Caudoviricetes sp.]